VCGASPMRMPVGTCRNLRGRPNVPGCGVRPGSRVCLLLRSLPATLMGLPVDRLALLLPVCRPHRHGVPGLLVATGRGPQSPALAFFLGFCRGLGAFLHAQYGKGIHPLAIFFCFSLHPWARGWGRFSVGGGGGVGWIWHLRACGLTMPIECVSHGERARLAGQRLDDPPGNFKARGNRSDPFFS